MSSIPFDYGVPCYSVDWCVESEGLMDIGVNTIN